MMNSNLDESFRKIITQSGLPLNQFAKATKTSALQTLKWWSKEDKVFLTDQQISHFEQHYAIEPESLINNKENLQLLRRRIFGENTALPEKYELGANSYVRSSFYILKYLTLLHGQEFTDNLLISLKVHPNFFDDLDKRINIQFITDLLEQCKILGFSDQDFENLANSMFLSVENTPMEKLFSGVSKYEDFYHQFKVLTGHFDKNYHYDFFVGITGADFVTRPNNDLSSLIDKTKTDLSIIYKYRPLIFSQSPQIAKLKGLGAELKVKSCISRGDRICHYSVRFPDVKFKIF